MNKNGQHGFRSRPRRVGLPLVTTPPAPPASLTIDALTVVARARVDAPKALAVPRAFRARVAELERVGLADHPLVDRLHPLALAVGLLVDLDREHRVHRDGGPHGDGEDDGEVLEAREQDLGRGSPSERTVARRLTRFGDAERRAEEEERRREREEERELLREVARVVGRRRSVDAEDEKTNEQNERSRLRERVGSA